MNKDTNPQVEGNTLQKSPKFSGQAIIAQVLNLIPNDIVNEAARKHKGDHYCKKLKTHEHLVIMLFGVITGCKSLRDKVNSILMLGNRLNHCKMTYMPARSTLSDANARRNPEIFEEIYLNLYQRYKALLADRSASILSQISQEIAQRTQNELSGKTLKIVDGTTISLFKEILKNSGRASQAGKKKGGIKCTVELPDHMPIPSFVSFSPGATNDKKMLSKLTLNAGDVVILDKGYNNYVQWKEWTDKGIFFVTRFNDNAKLEPNRNLEFDAEANNGVLADEYINLAYSTNNNADKENTQSIRCVTYLDEETKQTFYFATNLDEKVSPLTVALCYKKRWKIELLFKQLKQNFELKHFYGDNENALKIQIWSALIANLLITLIRLKTKTKIAFSGIVTLVRLHTGSYINLEEFLSFPLREWRRRIKQILEKRQLLIPFSVDGGHTNILIRKNAPT